jgi:DNA-binding transcriptional LysR family regulator
VEIRQLRLFVAVAEEGSIHGGARRLQMAQPPVSQALKKLERHVGGPLFVRSTRGVELTKAGVQLLDYAREILAHIDDATASVRQLAGQHGGTLRIGLMAGTVAAGELTWPIIGAFRDAYPAVDVEVRPLFVEPRYLCFSVRHPLAERDMVDVDDVLEFPMLEMVRTPTAFREFWQLNEARGGPPPRAYADSAVSLLEVAATLITHPVVMPVGLSAWRLQLQSPLLRAIPLAGVNPSDVAVAIPRGKRNPYAVAFAKCARAVCERQLSLVPQAALLAA